jgi:hypothetical protein
VTTTSRVCTLTLSLFALTLALEGCGAALPSQQPAAVVAVTPPAEPAADSTKTVSAPPPPPAAPSTVAPAPASVVAESAMGGSHERGAIAAGRELAVAVQQLQASAGDCTTACRALGSMERATAHLCALASSGDDQGTCQDARSKVLSGRDRVRTSCGECPGGPSLDRNAPIPSSR